MKIIASLFIALSLTPPHWAWSSETPFRLPNAQEIEAARAGEADFNASPWTDLNQAIEQHQEKAFFFGMDLFISLSKDQRREALGRFLAVHIDVELRTDWDVLHVKEPKRLRLILKWLKLRALELGNAPTWMEIPKTKFFLRIDDFHDLEFLLANALNSIRIRYWSIHQHAKVFQSHQGQDVFLFSEDFLAKYTEDRMPHLSERNNLELVITAFSFLPSDKRTPHLEDIVQEIQKRNRKPFLDQPFLLKEWPDTQIPQYQTWVEMLRDQTKNEADRAWAIQRLKELECSAELTSEAPHPGEATQ